MQTTTIRACDLTLKQKNVIKGGVYKGVVGVNTAAVHTLREVFTKCLHSVYTAVSWFHPLRCGSKRAKGHQKPETPTSMMNRAHVPHSYLVSSIHIHGVVQQVQVLGRPDGGG
eukprot:2648038-Prymnesium_polylepis.1